jgi:predicted transcriptional regulator
MRVKAGPQEPAGEGGGVMKDLKALDVMVRPVVAARKNAPVRDVVFQFLNGFYSGMPVTDDEGSVIGVITELDILEAVLAGKELVKITAGDIMTPKPATVDVDTPLTDVVKIMKEKNIIRLPVTEEGKLVGIVARCDILTTLIEPEFVTYM